IKNEAQEPLALGMLLVVLDVDNEFIAQFTISEAIPRHLSFYETGFLFQEEIHTASAARITWYPFLQAHILEFCFQQGTHNVLNIVFVLDEQRLPACSAVAQPHRHAVKRLCQLQQPHCCRLRSVWLCCRFVALLMFLLQRLKHSAELWAVNYRKFPI